jgi:hypothetical protein
VRIVGTTAIRLASVEVMIIALSGCTDGAPPVAPASTGPSVPVTASTAPAATPGPAVEVGGCPVTVPAPVPATEPWSSQLFGSNSAFGNGSLWVGGLPDGGVLDPSSTDVDPHGAVGRKFGWWRAIPGTLTITVRRLDASAPPGRGDVPAGYGQEGFQSSGITFPTPGCWEVTGSLEATQLTFVVLVRAP